MKTTKIFLFSLVLSLFAFNFINADTQSNVSGVVLDKGDEPVPGVFIVVYEHGTSNVLGSTYTNANGAFIISGISGIIDLLICFPEDEDEDTPAPFWYATSSDQAGATPINVSMDVSGVIIYPN